MFCAEKKIPLSKLLAYGAAQLMAKAKGATCGLCKNEAVGRYAVASYDWENGEQKKEMNFCEYHLKKAQIETEVTEVWTIGNDQGLRIRKMLCCQL